MRTSGRPHAEEKVKDPPQAQSPKFTFMREQLHDFCAAVDLISMPIVVGV